MTLSEKLFEPPKCTDNFSDHSYGTIYLSFLSRGLGIKIFSTDRIYARNNDGLFRRIFSQKV